MRLGDDLLDEKPETGVEDVAEDEVLVEEPEVEETESEAVEVDEAANDEQEEPELADEPEADDSSILVTLDDEEDEDDASQPFRELRQQNRELTKRLKELESGKDAEAVVDVGEKPKLSDFDYDSDKFSEALLSWNERKREADAKAQAEREAGEQLAAEYQERLAGYRSAAKSLGVKDFDAAEEVVKETLPEVVQSIIVDNAKRPELVTYALGKNPDLMKDLPKGGSFRDAAKAAYMLGQIEANLKVTGMKKKPKPEGRIATGAKSLATGERQLEKLREEAAKTGDYTKVNAYRRKAREQGK